jgi:hypothetical protein
VFYILSATLVFASLVLAYWISPHELGWHLGTSADRVVVVLFFIAVAALLQVAASLEAELRSRPESESLDEPVHPGAASSEQPVEPATAE